MGGLFYLLNLGLFLELYRDFTQPASPGIGLEVWDFVALLGSQLLVDEPPEDPLWELLARLAGRSPNEAPGYDFEPPDSWSLPQSWLTPFREQEPWSWELCGGRLRVHHPARFLVLDVPHAGGDPEERLHRETAGLSRAPSLAPAVGPALPEVAAQPAPLERWLGWVVPYARARLARALGLGDDPAELARTLLLHEARVHESPGRLDVVFSLADLPLPVRFAGLDRDIGWLPAAGRHIHFHFE